MRSTTTTKFRIQQTGFSNTHIENLIQKALAFLSCKLDNTIKPKIKIFQDLGFSSSDIANLMSTNPWNFRRSADALEQSVLVLKSILGSNAGVSKLLGIVQHMFTFPRLFLHKPETMKDFVRRVDELGVDRKSKRFLIAIRTISSMTKENWELKLKFLRNLGFSEDDTLSVFRTRPQALSITERKIKEVIELLRTRENVDISFIVNNPSVLLCSIESSLKPRLVIFDQLKTKNLLRRKTSLSTIFKLSKTKFIQRYVVPYSAELGQVSFL
ncbi:hypothetical protein JRO89_XS07G0145300 [Xanthoceras sorbifolium]|uniref:Uncharacterized protein n=1 Tax=Xanthoceras sorbifolium TaxID=99658 RepID=A0ABQ8HTT5_9ROSI|nr:hypothetical protein JRO89_XS07G0145300 [Xanthoceras sorbifolium]